MEKIFENQKKMSSLKQHINHVKCGLAVPTEYKIGIRTPQQHITRKKEKKFQNQSQLKTKISPQNVGEIKSKFYCAVLNYQKARIVCGINAKILLAIHIKT